MDKETKWNHPKTVNVRVTRLSEFILDAVATRKVPPKSGTEMWKRPPTVLMKLDIEGTVYRVETRDGSGSAAADKPAVKILISRAVSLTL